MLINLFVAQPQKLFEMPSDEARYILAARSWCLLRNTASDPYKRMQNYLPAPHLVMGFGLLMETVTQIWPDPFAIHRLCCGTASVDELLLVHAIRLARTISRPQFETLLHEMLPEDARALLFARAQALHHFAP